MIILIVGCVLITFMRRKTTKNKRFKGKKKQIKINLDPHKGETSGRRCCEKRALEISALLV